MVRRTTTGGSEVGQEFIGAGWAFPLRTDRTGSIALVRDQREIEESIHLILATSPGERPMRPEFGCSVHDYVFAPADAATAGDIAYAVRVALDRWEPRITLENVIVNFDGADAGVLLIDVQYTIRGTNDPRNLVFPFYVIPRNGEEAAS
jgi:phage baseplate assembly protein W